MKKLYTSNHSENVARLLATERITMYKSAVRTASFDIKNRVLVLPNWKDMSEEEELMLILHETAHAIFSTYDEYKVIFQDYPHLRGYCNIIEDARIETLMKERYAGSRGQFLRGYVSLHARNFFNVKGTKEEFAKMLPIDKLNLYFKIGGLVEVPLDEVEAGFADRIAKVRTIPEVIALASEIFEYTKDKYESPETDYDDLAGEGSDEESDGSRDEDEDDSDSNDEGAGQDGEGENGKRSQQDSDDEEDEDGEGTKFGPGRYDGEEYQPKTNGSLHSKLESKANTNEHVKYIHAAPSHNAMFEDVMVSYKTILHDYSTLDEKYKKSKEAAEQRGYIYHGPQEFKLKKTVISKFKKSNSPFVSHMIKEFEMKKAASAYKRTVVSKTGQLDMKKLFAYQIKDDLFKKTSRVNDVKNHGMIFLLDWSSSMSGCLTETVQQVISLASFCHKAQIPYQVLAFSDGYSGTKYRGAAIEKARKISSSDPDNPLGYIVCNFSLLEFFNHNMTNTEFNLMQDLLLSKFYQDREMGAYGLFGTPLNEAMLYMTDYVGEFKKKHNVEKMSLITLTDGCGSNLSVNNAWDKNQIDTGAGADPYVKRPSKFIVIDKMTKHQYAIDRPYNNDQMDVICDMIKTRWNAKVIGFYLIRPSYSEFRSFLMIHSDVIDIASAVRDGMAKLNQDHAAIFKDFAGRDEMYVLNSLTKIVDVEDSLDKIDGESDDELVHKTFSSAMVNSKKSRVVLSKFIDQIA